MVGDTGSALSAQGDAARIRQIFRFLAAAEESRTKPVRTLDSALRTVWFADLPDDRRVASAFEGTLATEEGAWLTVERPHRDEPPQLPTRLRPWLDLGRIRDFASPHAPHLRRRIEPELPDYSHGIPLEKLYHELDSHPKKERIEELYAAWEREWQSWAERRRAVDPLVQLYDNLHRMYEDSVTLGEAYELVIGFGYLTWSSASGDRVGRHLVTHRATLHLNALTGTLTAAPDRSAAGLMLEEGMLDAERRVQGEAREDIRQAMEQAADVTDPEHLEDLHTALRSWANSAHSAARYLPGLERHRSQTFDIPTVGFSPTLVLRERTRRSTLEALSTIAQQVERGAEAGDLLHYIAGGDGVLSAAQRANAERDDTPREVYFAMPANAEQRTIAERLRHNHLVVVQGPPGTGKTHTIANLVTDLLAQGKRVLITSHTPRALRVLRDKLPEEIRQLCVSRTEDGTSAQRELEASVQTILSRFANYDPRASQQEIDRLEARLAAARSAQNEVLGHLAELREQETRRFPADLGDYSGSLQEIAKRLAAEAADHSWLGPIPQDKPTLTAQEALLLLTVARAYTPEQRALAAEVPGPAELPTPGDFEEAVAAVRTAEEAHAAVRDEPIADRYDSPVALLTEARQAELSAALDGFVAARVRAAARAQATGQWASGALDEILTGRDWQVKARHAATAEALRATDAALAELGGALITGLEQYDLASALNLATTLHDGLRQGQKLRGAFGRTKLAKSVGPFAEKVLVDGRGPQDAGTAARVLARIILERHLNQVENEWGSPATLWQAAGPRLARLRQEAEVLDALLAVGQARTALITAAATSPELAEAPWHEQGIEIAIRALLRARATLRDAERSRRLIAQTEELLRTWTDRSGPAPALLRAREAVTGRAPDAYRRACDELAGVREATQLRGAYEPALDTVRDAFPALAERIVAAPADPEWEGRLTALGESWAWTAWHQRVERLTDPGAEEELRRRLGEADDEARITLRKLAAARAWHGSLGLLTGDQTTALNAYQHAVRRIKGKYQHRYRQQAQTALRQAQGAVPAWIMPLYQVAETIPMDRPGIFDVVIVDEASQSGLEAMLLSWLADRIVVVGDGKQVSPSNVGLKHEEYFGLRQRLLTGLPDYRRDLFGPDMSFFDLAESLAGGRGTLMLKEHFRCMPEIISFSNELCYNDQLLPLRQYGADRLPPVRTVLVEDGEAVGNNSRLVNLAEAEALVETLVSCCEDPAYEGRTMGVISLRASAAHRQELENLLVNRLPYEEREQRRIRVGDAEDFQGDERDVMFISLVNSATKADGSVPGGYSGKSYEQRLNVAASRARDQVWAFHSARVDQFHPNDLRRHYLDHLTRPAEESVAAVEDEVLPDQRHPAFENLFQQHVYLELTGRGYRVRPQYEVGRHAIDLVVEGGTRRLAVECDGDVFAEGEDAASTAARQRDLERVDWSFVRIRGSRFYLDREKALAPLWAELERLGVTPAASPEPGDSAESASPGEPPQHETSATAEPAAAAPVTEPIQAEEAPAPPAARQSPMTFRQDRFPVREINAGCHKRVLMELYGLQRALSEPDETPPGLDPANLAFLWNTQNRQRARREERVAFLRAFLDAVSLDSVGGDPQFVVPGSLLVLDMQDEAGGHQLRTITELPSEEAEQVSPASPLGQALMWQPVGRVVEYATANGRESKAVIREIRS